MNRCCLVSTLTEIFYTLYDGDVVKDSEAFKNILVDADPGMEYIVTFTSDPGTMESTLQSFPMMCRTLVDSGYIYPVVTRRWYGHYRPFETIDNQCYGTVIHGRCQECGATIDISTTWNRIPEDTSDDE